MISKDDIIGLCGLDEDEVDAVAEHEHLPDVAAAALASYLLHKVKGADRIRVWRNADKSGGPVTLPWSATVDDPTAVLAGVGAGGIGTGATTGTTSADPGVERREVLGDLIDNQPDEVAQLLRSWLGDRREVTR